MNIHRDSGVGVRIDELFVGLAVLSKDHMHTCIDAGVLSWMSRAFLSDDLLLKLNCYQPLTTVTQSITITAYILTRLCLAYTGRIVLAWH